MDERLDLWDYRRRMWEIYRRVRGNADPQSGWQHWIEGRDRLFREHPQSPLSEDARSRFQGLPYHPYDPAWRFEVPVEPIPGDDVELTHSGAGSTAFTRIGTLELDTPAGAATVTLFWLDTYGGGVFLPFRDLTNGNTSYGGGRYLLDSAKGADLGHSQGGVTVDFNFSYHPSCVHDSRWSCPLAPPENHLRIEVPVGERLPTSTRL